MSPPHVHANRRSFGLVASAGAALACALAVSAAGAAGGGGGPSFAAGPSLPVGPSATSAAVGDFDGNGSPDLAVANAGYRSNVRILLNDGAGRFRVAPDSPFKAGSSTSVAKADFNGDGKLDLAVAGEDLRILLGDGSARFTAAPGSPLRLSAYPQDVTPADLNGDGRPDLVVLTWSENTDYGLSMLLNDGTGRLTALPGPRLTGKPDSVSLAVADFDRDGKEDLAVAADNSTKLSVFPGNGAGGFGPAVQFPAGKTPGQLATGDFNGDGRPDLAVFVKTGLAILLGDGAGGFKPAPGSPIASAAYGYALAIADLDGDGKLDLAFADPDSSSGALVVLLGNGAGAFHPAPFSPFYAGWPSTVVTADFNADGRTDLFPLSSGVTWGPAPRGNMIVFQTPLAPLVHPGRTLPAKADAVFSTRQSISKLAADGRRAAICSNRLFVWRAPTGKSSSLAAECDSELAIAGARVAWIEYGFGNTHRSVDVFVADASGRGRRQVGGEDDIETENPDDPTGSWWGQLLGAGSVLAYNSWWVDCVPPPCDQECYDEGGGGCDDANPTLRVRGQHLTRVAGRRPVAVRRGPDAYPLRAVGGGRMAVEPAAGVVVLTANGSPVATVPAQKEDPPRGVALSATRLALLRTFTLDLYNPATGAKQSSIALGPAAGLELAGVTSKLALLRSKGHLVLARLSDGKLVSFPLGTAAAARLVDAKLTGDGLFYAYNLPRGARKGRVVFEPTAKLLARF